MRALACAAGLPLLGLAGPASSASGDEPLAAKGPVVIELFTSQGCSSCPPADRLLGKVARQPNVFAVTLPVDLWDYVGWKDTLALPYHAKRQKQYSKARGDNRVYTPQAVINGISHVIGSDPAALRKAAEECYGREGALGVDIKAEPTPEGLKIELGAAPENAPKAATLWLVRVASHRNVKINRGENAGRTFTYLNVAREFMRVGEWQGERASFSVDRDKISGPDSDGWLLLLQSGPPGRPGVILAAAKSAGL